jgi:hypothetical protein
LGINDSIRWPRPSIEFGGCREHSTYTVRVVWIFCLLCVCTQPLFSTTLVIKLENDRILLAADTRQERFNPGQTELVQGAGDDGRCKIRVLGQIGFAATGFLEYQANDPSNPLADWSAFADASATFDKVGDNIRNVAAEWARRSASHFIALHAQAPERVKQMASANPENLLQIAFFTGWDRQTPVLLMEIVSFDPKASPVIGTREIEQPLGDVAFSTNTITQELINGASPRAQKAGEEWDTNSEDLATRDLAWKHVEFYIKKTAAYDTGVSAVVDVVSLPAGKPATWLQKGACF